MKKLPKKENNHYNRYNFYNHYKIYSILIFSLLFALGSLLISYVYAQSNEDTRNYTVIPPAIEYSIKPGAIAEGTLKIVNDAPEITTFNLTVQDFIVGDTVGTPTILPPNTLSNKYSAAAWLGVTPGTITVKSHERKNLRFYLQVPSDARPGGHYAAVIYTPQNTLGVKGTGAAVQTQIGTLFYIGVQGPITEKAVVTEFKANRFQEYGPVEVKTQIKNMGDLHIRPNGYISVTNMFGQRAYVVPLDQHNIFPETARDFINTFGRKLMIGRYTVSFLATYGTNNNLPLSASIVIWIFPWKITLLIILIVIAAILGIMYMKKKNKEDLTNSHQPPAQP